ncbi:hypothetical protein PVAP13_5KG011612 [Panicum virgatum]|uniref:Uncharacterized protein n=1 Tax=Panicum virgatum TaxID=38727 RepID=A0A8T0SE92_PANVG|nr:hypothetical protein PVAP13_5KG011612 [Panicum virgatum]
MDGVFSGMMTGVTEVSSVSWSFINKLCKTERLFCFPAISYKTLPKSGIPLPPLGSAHHRCSDMRRHRSDSVPPLQSPPSALHDRGHSLPRSRHPSKTASFAPPLPFPYHSRALHKPSNKSVPIKSQGRITNTELQEVSLAASPVTSSYPQEGYRSVARRAAAARVSAGILGQMIEEGGGRAACPLRPPVWDEAPGNVRRDSTSGGQKVTAEPILTFFLSFHFFCF